MNARFNVGGGMAYLYPQSQASCAICGAKSWSDPIILRESVIITETVTFPAKGIIVLSHS